MQPLRGLCFFLVNPLLIFAATASQSKNATIIQPSYFQNRLSIQDEPSSIKVQSQANDTSLSRRHPFACWEFPDFFSRHKRTYPAASKQSFDLTCWTNAIAGQMGKYTSQSKLCDDNEVLWFKTTEQCWLPDFNVQPRNGDDLREKLRYCPPPLHMVGGFQDQYQGKSYCYTCTKLDCGAKPRSLDRNKAIDLNCWVTGSKVEGDDIWWRLGNEDCYIPNQVFNPLLFQGNGLECSRR